MKYFTLLKKFTSNRPMCMISRSSVFLVAPFFVCFVCLPIIQSTHAFRSVKSKSVKSSNETKIIKEDKFFILPRK